MVKIALILSLFFTPLITKKVAHPLYVSVTEIEWNSKEKSMEIVCKIFLEDFEATLKKTTTKAVDLYAAQNEGTKQIMLDYFKKHLQITVDGKLGNLTIIGYEQKKEAVWCYLECKGVNTASTINVMNNLLYEFSEKQINLLHVTVGGVTKNFKLGFPDTNTSFSF